MKYIYKHGNQYWYQRAIPSKLMTVIGKKTLKISLKTNKISTAIKRSKLQALEHKKMFINIQKKSNKYFKKLLDKVNINTNIDKYTLFFEDDYDDLLNKLLFNKSELVNFYTDGLEKDKKQTLENLIFETNEVTPFLSKVIDKYLTIKKINKYSKKASSIVKSISLMIKVCGDKPLIEYSTFDAKKFRNYFVDLNQIATGKRNQSNIQNLFSVFFNEYSLEKKNPFSGLEWPEYEKKINNENFSLDDLRKIKNFCIKNNEFISLICGIIFDTGCSVKEVIGLKKEDIDLNKHNPYIIIRSNSVRRIDNIYKRRIIPLVGIAYESMKKIKIVSSEELLFNYYLKDKYKNYQIVESKLNTQIKKLVNRKTYISFKHSLIERLKEIGCPEKIIAEIIGLAKRKSFYSEEISLDVKFSWLNQIIIE